MDTIWMLVKMIIFLGIILYLANWSLRALERHSQPTGKKMEVLDRIAVSKTAAIGVVKVVDNYYLMSFSEQGTDILKELSVSEVAVYLEKDMPSKEVQASKFAGILQKNIQKITRKGKSADEK